MAVTARVIAAAIRHSALRADATDEENRTTPGGSPPMWPIGEDGRFT
jgi:hypothetical protein